LSIVFAVIPDFRQNDEGLVATEAGHSFGKTEHSQADANGAILLASVLGFFCLRQWLLRAAFNRAKSEMRAWQVSIVSPACDHGTIHQRP
jgi:hypothetical protein